MTNKTNPELIEMWTNKLLNLNNKAPGTVKGYMTVLKQFAEFIDKPLGEADCNDIEAYLSNKNSSGTKQRKQTVICRFYNWMYDHKYCERHPKLERETFSKPKRNPEFIEREQWHIIQKSLTKKMNTFTKERDYMIIYTLLHSGVRVSEVVKIKVEDINFLRQELKVIGKRNKERIIFINKVNLNVIENYIRRNSLTEYLFPNMQDVNKKPITPMYVAKICSKITDNTNIDIHPHVFRHTYAQWLTDDGKDVRIVQQQLGHESIATTQIYQSVRNEQVRKAINE